MTILRQMMIAVLAVVLLATVPAWAVPNYIAIRLGTVGVETSGSSINASGQVTGASSFDRGPYHAFHFSGGTMQDLGTLGGAGGFSGGRGIDNAGRVVGYALTADFAVHAFLYSDGTMQDLGTLGGQDSYGYGINTSGQVIGIAQTNSNGVFHAFLYSGGTMQDLGTLGGQGSYAYGINASGQVTGSAKVDVYSGYEHAFLRCDGRMQDLGTLGGPKSVGYGINASGQVIGEADINSSGGFHAFLYSGGTMQDLGTLGGTASSGRGINGSGEAVGSSTASVGGPPRAFLYSGGTMYDLNLLVVSGLGGATLVEASGINDSGQIVANTCQNAPMGCAAFRLDPIAGPAIILPTVEFYNASLDHYFMTSMPNEIAILDAGTQIKGWARTGYSFKAYTTAQAGTSPACRYYIPPGYGDSHFFSAASDECAIALIKFPWLFKETDAAFHIALPNTTTGACKSNETPVYRLWNGRADSNHRYTASTSVKSSMIANGYIAEGYGPDQVDMCAPQ